MRRAVDWREVERELEELPEDFKDQGAFDSLPHVVEILRTLDPSQALGELRDRQQRVEALVDDIVKGYHGGFNKSIHNYSEILRLFTEAQTQGKSIRTSLLALKKQLAASAGQAACNDSALGSEVVRCPPTLRPTALEFTVNKEKLLLNIQ